jgi:hypothetical protein
VRKLRVIWTIASVVIVETVVVGTSVLPAFLCWTWLFTFPVPPWLAAKAVLAAISFVPAYLVFCITLA